MPAAKVKDATSLSFMGASIVETSTHSLAAQACSEALVETS